MAVTTVTTVQDSATALSQLAAVVLNSPHEFLRPTSNIQQVAVQAAKFLLDPLATDVINTQITRRDENRKKRKRGENEEELPVLQLRQVYTKGFDVKQVWEQAKRILDAAHQEVERDIKLYQNSLQHFSQSRKEEASADDESHASLEEGDDDKGDEDGQFKFEEMDDDDVENGEGLEVEDEEDIEVESDVTGSSDELKTKKNGTYFQDRHGLNDGFFSIDDFNKQSQFLEQMDTRGEDDNPSDEDEVDWDADPLSVSLSGLRTSRSRKNQQEDNVDSDEDEDEEGPTFGDADLDVSENEGEGMLDDEDQELEGITGGLSNANEVRYADFFEPPPKKPSKTKRMRALPKTQPPKATQGEPSKTAEEQLQNDLERAIADVRRDLLDSDEEELSEGDESDSDDGIKPEKPKHKDKNMSTHEKQRAAIAIEIRRLEAANVAKRDWQLRGEARAAERPVNSLLEENLEFERAGKPITPVTAETTEEIDALIKRRILAREFDEVIRRVPSSLNLASETRRGRIEVDDTKPQASLGEIYEAEHQKNADPLSYVDKRSAATKKKHAEIDVLWKQVRDQLDLLSNMHFKPKRVDVEIKTVEDKPRIVMEDARPVGEIESGEGGMLAPQEVYQPGIDSKGGKDEITLQNGAAVAREEMSREEKLRRRRREKERSKKAQNNKELNVLGKTSPGPKATKKEKEVDKVNIIEDLKRGGVKIVGKGGELQSIGRQKKDRGGGEVIASNLKL